ncbi:MAG: OmpA family protein [Bacteroidales bacterium]|nr:OmpA family protein [Bacteroidales bacterium]
MKKVISIVAIVVMALSSAFAQENNNRDENGNIVRGPYLTNDFGDNWFFSIGAGANTLFSTPDVKFGFGGLAVEANLGKWFTPSVGARIGYRGIDNSFKVKPGYTTMIDNGTGDWDAMHYAHGDLLWNLSNALSGYKETRFWNIIPYATAGWLGFKSPYYKVLNGDDREVEDEWTVGAGILNNFRLGDKVGLYIDLSVLSTRHEILAISPRATVNHIFAFVPAATAGLTFNFGGRTNWDRFSSVAPKAPVLSFTEDDYKALQAKLADLEAKNKNLVDDLEAAKNVKPETVVVTTEGKKQIVLFFDLAKDNLKPSEIAHLRAFASKLAPGTKLKVTGSADSGTGNEKINTKLATARANVVVDVLTKEFGISRDDIEIDHTFDIFGNNQYSRAALVE